MLILTIFTRSLGRVSKKLLGCRSAMCQNCHFFVTYSDFLSILDDFRRFCVQNQPPFGRNWSFRPSKPPKSPILVFWGRFWTPKLRFWGQKSTKIMIFAIFGTFCRFLAKNIKEILHKIDQNRRFWHFHGCWGGFLTQNRQKSSILADFWWFWTIFGHFFTILGHFSRFWDDFCRFWQKIAICDKKVTILTHGDTTSRELFWDSAQRSGRNGQNQHMRALPRKNSVKNRSQKF